MVRCSDSKSKTIFNRFATSENFRRGTDNSFTNLKNSTYHFNFNKFWCEELSHVNTIEERIELSSWFHTSCNNINVSTSHEWDQVCTDNLFTQRLFLNSRCNFVLNTFFRLFCGGENLLCLLSGN